MRKYWHRAAVAAVLLLTAAGAGAASGKVIKVLPHYLDARGRHALSPSLYDRDAYQEQLRKNPALRAGLRFDIQWQAYGAADLKVRIELRGMKSGQPQSRTLELAPRTKPALTAWSKLTLDGEDYRQFGELSAWRATLWEGGQLLAEQQSFLWSSDPQVGFKPAAK